jgi:hypothetical protein
MTADVRLHKSDDIQDVANEIVSIYRAVFARPPYNESLGMADAFACGYRSGEGQFWHDAVRAALAPDVAQAWMDNSSRRLLLSRC